MRQPTLNNLFNGNRIRHYAGVACPIFFVASVPWICEVDLSIVPGASGNRWSGFSHYRAASFLRAHRSRGGALWQSIRLNFTEGRITARHLYRDFETIAIMVTGLR